MNATIEVVVLLLFVYSIILWTLGYCVGYRIAPNLATGFVPHHQREPLVLNAAGAARKSDVGAGPDGRSHEVATDPLAAKRRMDQQRVQLSMLAAQTNAASRQVPRREGDGGGGGGDGGFHVGAEKNWLRRTPPAYKAYVDQTATPAGRTPYRRWPPPPHTITALSSLSRLA